MVVEVFGPGAGLGWSRAPEMLWPWIVSPQAIKGRLSDLGLGHFMEETHDQNVAVAYRECGQLGNRLDPCEGRGTVSCPLLRAAALLD